MITYEMPDDSLLRITIEDDKFVQIRRRGKLVEVEVYRERTVIEKLPVNASVNAFKGASYMGGSLVPCLEDAQAGRTRRSETGSYEDPPPQRSGSATKAV